MLKAKKRATIKAAFREVVRANPPFMSTVYTYVAPAAAGFILARAAGYGAYKLVEKRKPNWSKGAFTAGQLAALAILYYGMKHKKVDKYRTAALTGAGVAVLQSIIVMLAPKLAKYLGMAMPAALVAPKMTQAELRAIEEESDEYGSLAGTPALPAAPAKRKIIVNIPQQTQPKVEPNAAGEEVLDDLGTEPTDDNDTTWGIN